MTMNGKLKKRPSIAAIEYRVHDVTGGVLGMA
jgi:hypothetical protein